MIRKIVLSNFMAHAHTELKLADGLTVLVGPNNIGKSTVAVALKILARNTNSNFVMQHEQKDCSISVETSEGYSIQWIKRKSPSYIINGQAKDRLGRGGTPPELDETLRLAPVEFEDKDFEPHFGDQKSPIFLINRPPSQIAQFFSTTSDAEKLVAMQRLHQKHRTEAQNTAKMLSTKNEAIQHSLDALEVLPKLESEFAILERVALSIESLAKEITNIENLIRSYAEVTREWQFEQQRTTCLTPLQPMPVIQPTEHLESVATQWTITMQNHLRFDETIQMLKGLAATPTMGDEKPLAKIANDLGKAFEKFEYWRECVIANAELFPPSQFTRTDHLQSAVDGILELETETQKLFEIKQAASKLAESPTLVPEDGLGKMICKLVEVSFDHLRLEAFLENLMELHPITATPDDLPLRDAILALEKTKEQFTNNQSLLENVHESIAALEFESERWLSTKPTCSTCGAELSADSIRYKMHRHGQIHDL